VAVTSSQINLAWDDNSDNESYYVVIRKTGGAQTTIGTFENATEFKDTDLFPDSLYTYSVMAYNYKGFSTASNEVSLKTLPDTGGADLYPAGMDSLTLIVTPLSVSSSATVWLFPLNRLHGIQPWAIERSFGSPDNFQTIDTMEISINSNPYPDQGIDLDTTVYYRLRAIGNNPPFYSNTTHAVTIPVDTIPYAPTNLRAVAVTSGQVQLEWDDNDDEAFYTIHRKMGKVNIPEALTPTDVTQYQDKELLPQTTYTYYITAYNYKGHSLASNEVTVTTSGLFALPDTTFAQWLDAHYEGLIINENQLVLSKAAEITTLDLGWQMKTITDIDGLQHFTSLEDFKGISPVRRVPDLSGLSQLQSFVLTEANLSFTYLLALEDLNFDSLHIENGLFELNVSGTSGQNQGVSLIDLGNTVELENGTLRDMHAQSIFHWYKNHELIAGESGLTFTINDYKREDVGEYSLKVTNPLSPGDTLEFRDYLITINNLPAWWPEQMAYEFDVQGDHYLIYPATDYLEEGAIEPGDVIGVFYEDENGNLQTNTVGIWTGKYLGAAGKILLSDDEATASKTGFAENEPIQFKLWDPVRAQEFDVEPEYAPVGEEKSLTKYSPFYQLLEDIGIEHIEDDIVFTNDGLFHPSLITTSPTPAPGVDDGSWFYSVIVNWTGKNPAPWEAVTAGPENHLIIVPSDVIADIQGEPLEVGDYIGFFFEDEIGELVCSDFAVWTGENLVLNPWISNATPKNGYDEGEKLKMKIWKENSKLEYLADSLTFSSVPPLDASGLFKANGLSKLTYIQVKEVHAPHDIPLYPGWNLVSSYQIPQDTRMSEVLKDVSPVIVKNDRGDVVYAPQNGIHSGSWDYDHGYQVYVIAEDTISVSGAIVEAGATIDIALNTYPYFLPYWYENPQAVEQVMSSIDGRFDYVQQIKYDKDEKRFYAENYIPSHIISPAIDQIGQMSAGLAYKVKMNQAAQFVLQDLSGGESSGGKIAQTNRKPQYFMQDIQRSPDNVIVVISEKVLQDANSFSEGDEIAILSPSGKTMGAGVYSGSGMAITAWDVEGIMQGNPLSFKLWGHETDEVLDLEISSETGASYHPGKLIMISGIKTPDSYRPGPSDLRFVVYPNPVRSDLYIHLPFSDGDNGEATLTDLSGRMIFSQTIDPGSGITQCDIPEIKSGLYILEVQIDRNGEVWNGKQKVIISD
jgi:hypothetical protein